MRIKIPNQLYKSENRPYFVLKMDVQPITLSEGYKMCPDIEKWKQKKKKGKKGRLEN